MNLKVGDKLRCKQEWSSRDSLTFGKTYEVQGFDDDGDPKVIWDDGECAGAHIEWFDLIEEPSVTLKIKKIAENAIIPKYAKAGDAGLDLTATSKSWDEINEVVVFGTGLAVEIPPGHVGLIFPRSSNFKVGLSLSNCVGVIDSGYRGEIKFMFRPTGRPRKNYEVGDRIGQLIVIPYPQVKIEEVTELSDSERGEGGFGSSGK